MTANDDRLESHEIRSERVRQLSDIAAAAGIMDVAEGAEILAASEDVAATSAMVGLMSGEDLESGLALARIAGEMWAIGDVVELLQMPVYLFPGKPGRGDAAIGRGDYSTLGWRSGAVAGARQNGRRA